MKKRSKRYKKFLPREEKKLSLKEIIDRIKNNCTTKFDESIDISMRINLKQSKGGEFNLRTIIKLPNKTGKKINLAVLCETDKVQEVKKLGINIVGSEDLIDIIAKKKINFNKLICTPGMMGKIGKYGKILGPKGLMPNPKLGTVTTDVKKTIEDINNGLIEIKNDKDGNVSSSVGRKSHSSEKIFENIKFFIENIKKERPETIKGDFIKSTYISSTMGISYKFSGRI